MRPLFAWSIERVRARALAAAIVVATALVAGACSPSSAGSGAPSGSPSAGAQPTRIPLLIDARDVVGENRFLFGLTDRANKPIGTPDLRVQVAFFDLGTSPTAPAIAAQEATFIWAIPNERGIYVAHAKFGRAGDWAAEFTTNAGGVAERTRVKFQVQESGPTPLVGAKAPDTKTPTLASAGGDVAKISTDTRPDRAFYRLSVDQALKDHKPFVLVFATPRFCQSAQCGPTLDAIKAIAKDEPKIAFIHVEPYKLEFTNGQLQPVLDANGQLQATDVTNAWGLLTEPWIFVVDGSGVVRGSFAIIVSPAELRQAIAAATK